jgi:hypothetical protein
MCCPALLCPAHPSFHPPSEQNFPALHHCTPSRPTLRSESKDSPKRVATVRRPSRPSPSFSTQLMVAAAGRERRAPTPTACSSDCRAQETRRRSCQTGGQVGRQDCCAQCNTQFSTIQPAAASYSSPPRYSYTRLSGKDGAHAAKKTVPGAPPGIAPVVCRQAGRQAEAGRQAGGAC